MKILRFLTLIFLTLMLSCCWGPRGYIKKSANEEVFDTKGFRGKKRMPMYNAKYISKAKSNLASGDLEVAENEDDNPYYENDELVDYPSSNRKMYEDMLEMKRSKRNLGHKNNYPKLSEIDNSYKDQKQQNDLANEIKSIKKLLQDTREKLTSQKCTTDVNSAPLPTHQLPQAEISNNKEIVAGMINSAPKELLQSKTSNSKTLQCR